MKKIVLPIHYGLPGIHFDCFTQYPNGNSFILGGCVVRFIKFGIDYRCIECKKQWDANQCIKNWGKLKKIGNRSRGLND